MKNIKKPKQKEAKIPYWKQKEQEVFEQARQHKVVERTLSPEESVGRQVSTILRQMCQNSPETSYFTVANRIVSNFTDAHKKNFLQFYAVLSKIKWTDKFLERIEYALPLLHMAKKMTNVCEVVKGWKPTTRNAGRQVRSLIDFLFVKYAMPTFLYDAWFKDTDQHIDWFIALAKGDSVRSLNLPIEPTKKMAHTFLQAPDYMTVSEALRYAQVLSMGGDEHLAWYVNASFLGRNNFEHENFWSKVIQFFAQVGMFETEKLPEIMDYLRAQYEANPSFNMKGRTVQALLRQTEDWHATLRQQTRGVKYAKDLVWIGSGIPTFVCEFGSRESNNYQCYTIRELLSSKELFAEGNAQKHCVGSYAPSCVRGENAIFTMDWQSRSTLGSKLITIQVKLSSMQIVQAKGKCNRTITDMEREIMNRWATREGLNISKFL
jgi:hypothetical protein